MVLHRKNPAVREKPVFEGLLRYPKAMAEREGLRRPFSLTTPITLIKQRGSAGYDYTDDYIVDYRSDQQRRIARSPVAVNT
ncbi:hypothetical protein ACVILK_005426 [Bradyrhizobium embrapense]